MIKDAQLNPIVPVPFLIGETLSDLELEWMKRLYDAGISGWIVSTLRERWIAYSNTEKFQHMIDVLCSDDQKYGLGKLVFGRDFISSDHDIATLLLYLQFPVATLLEIQEKFAVDFSTKSVEQAAIGVGKVVIAGPVILAATLGGSFVYLYHHLIGYAP